MDNGPVRQNETTRHPDPTGAVPDRRESPAAAPWWAAGLAPPPSPIGSLMALGGRNPRARVGLLMVLLAVVLAFRMAAFPASIWDQDEAYLGLGVADFDPAANRPHPPWFPGWVFVGRAFSIASADPALGLRLVSAIAGLWTLFPLLALLSIWLRRDLAVAGAMLYLSLPGPWFLAGRAHSDTPGAFLLVAAAAWWLRPAPRKSDLVAGSIAAGLCLLVRPQLAVGIVGLALWTLATERRRGDRLLTAAPLTAVTAAGAAAAVWVAGGATPFAAALKAHVGYHLGGLHAVDASFAASGIARCLISPELAAVWMALAAVGMGVWVRHRSSVGRPWPLMLGLLSPLALTIVLLSNPTIARYALPVLALSTVPVMMGLAAICGRWTVPLVALLVTISIGFGLPQAQAYRAAESPAVAALREADRLAVSQRATLVVDRRLVSFAEYGRAAGWMTAPLINDFQLEIGAAPSPPDGATVSVFARNGGGFVRAAAAVREFRCGIAWVSRLEADRFTDITVASGSRVVATPSEW